MQAITVTVTVSKDLLEAVAAHLDRRIVSGEAADERRADEEARRGLDQALVGNVLRGLARREVEDWIHLRLYGESPANWDSALQDD